MVLTLGLLMIVRMTSTGCRKALLHLLRGPTVHYDDGPTRSANVTGFGHLVSGGTKYAAAEQVLSDSLPKFLIL